MPKLFGTDGVRGIVNKDLNIEKIIKLTLSVAKYYKNSGKVLIAKDTRISGDMLENIISGLLTSAGFQVELAGVLPTPILSYLTSKNKYTFSVMISASHNPYNFNGIKFFSAEGFKLTRSEEKEIEDIYHTIDDINKFTTKTENISKINNIPDIYTQYIDFIKKKVDITFNYKIIIDTANGATYKIAPEIFNYINTDNIIINNKPDGININKDCGSTYIENLKELVLSKKADFALAYDGDGDRVLFLDRHGRLIDGDSIMYLLSLYYKKRNILNNNCVVATVMSNMAFEKSLKEENISLIRASVGDINVLNEMLNNNCIIGGEQSGHIILLNHAKTGDGILTSIEVLNALKNLDIDLSEIKINNYPQKLVNIEVEDKHSVLENQNIKNQLDKIKEEYKDKARIVIRPSGTEPVIRIMVEAEDKNLVQQLINKTSKIIIGG